MVFECCEVASSDVASGAVAMTGANRECHTYDGRVCIHSGGQVTEVPAQIYLRPGQGYVRIRFAHPPEPDQGVKPSDHSIITIVSGGHPSLRVRRFGAVESAYHFEAGQTIDGFLQLRQGRMPLRIFTAALDVKRTAAQVEVQVKADIEGQVLQIAVLVTWDPAHRVR